MCLIDTVLVCQFLLRRPHPFPFISLAYFRHFIISQLSHCMVFAMRQRAVFSQHVHVVLMSPPFQIIEPIIASAAIQVHPFLTIRARADKCFKNKIVHVLLAHTTVSMQIDLDVPVIDHYARQVMPAATAA